MNYYINVQIYTLTIESTNSLFDIEGSKMLLERFGERGVNNNVS